VDFSLAHQKQKVRMVVGVVACMTSNPAPLLPVSLSRLYISLSKTVGWQTLVVRLATSSVLGGE
jgi:hypothetical protein